MTGEPLVTNASLPNQDETHTKNLFLRDKKHGLFLVSVATNAHRTTPVQTKTLGKLLGLAGKTNLRLADPSLLLEYLHAQPGCVGPLCAAVAKQDGDEKVQLVLDQNLTNGTYTKIHSHPLRNDQSVAMTPEALLSCLKTAGVEPLVVDFGQAEAPPAGKMPAGGGPKPKPTQEPKKKGDKKKGGGGDAPSNKKSVKKGETLLALQWKKDENFAQWYTDVIVLSEMIAYYDISGCYILRPWSYKIWELMQEWFNVEVRTLESICLQSEPGVLLFSLCDVILFGWAEKFLTVITFQRFIPCRSANSAWRIVISPSLSLRIVWRRKRTTSKDLRQKWRG